MLKLDHYGVRGTTHAWIKDFLGDRTQQVVLDGEHSSTAPVTSGVPQGTVLGPLLFMAYINDLPDQVTSTARLFADDCLLYRTIKNDDDTVALQKDLDSLQTWENNWLMQFNPDKCEVIHITNKRKFTCTDYSIHNKTLHTTDNAKYLGVTINKKLSWNTHIDNICKKANSTRAFLQRNLSKCPTNIKAKCYTTFIRPSVEFTSTVWDPHTKRNIDKLEAVQRKAARFVLNDYARTSSVTTMLTTLRWDTLQRRRHIAKIAMTLTS